MEIEIRKATYADLETLRTMEQGVIEAERPFDPTLREDSIQYYDLEGLLENPKALVLVATHEDAIVSCGYALEKQGKPYLKHETYAYLGFMFTELEYRGNGLNGTILDNLKEWAQENGLTEIRLTVYDENSAALRAYEKIGFKKPIIEMRWPLSE
jgi:ribosomal protein S18 acetylase RimI-like enzyme